jgi:ATP-dependent exoDNAse (exonuclease V) alpha subunit
VTVLGSLPSVSAGEWLTAKGWWVRDKEHGLQFKAQVLKAVPPTTSEGVERYLAGGFVKGVGPVLAKKLVGHFGAEVLGVIENNPADRTQNPPTLAVMGVRPPLPAPRKKRVSFRSWLLRPCSGHLVCP